jgi:hypothetical protein
MRQDRRLKIDRLLTAYLTTLGDICLQSNDAASSLYRSHLKEAETIQARYRCGESEAGLLAALQVELRIFQSEELPGDQAELVGLHFGNLCRAVGLR